MAREKVHLSGQWECVEGVYFSNLLWDWKEEFFPPTQEELQLLNQGYCPYCDEGIISEDNLF